MKYLHTMVRVKNLEQSLIFYRDALGLKEIRRTDYSDARFTLVYLSCEDGNSELELTYNWDDSSIDLEGGRNFGHLAYGVKNIYATCKRLRSHNIEILRPPRDGKMAFIRSPDGISIEFLQIGEALEVKGPWNAMENQGEW